MTDLFFVSLLGVLHIPLEILDLIPRNIEFVLPFRSSLFFPCLHNRTSVYLKLLPGDQVLSQLTLSAINSPFSFSNPLLLAFIRSSSSSNALIAS